MACLKVQPVLHGHNNITVSWGRYDVDDDLTLPSVVLKLLLVLQDFFCEWMMVMKTD